MVDRVVHVLRVGVPICRFTKDVPGSWPSGHVWVSFKEFVERDFNDNEICGSCNGIASALWDAFAASGGESQSELQTSLAEQVGKRPRVSFTTKDLDGLMALAQCLPEANRREFLALVEQARIVSPIAEVQSDCTLLVRTERLNVTSRELVEIDEGDRLLLLSTAIEALKEIGTT